MRKLYFNPMPGLSMILVISLAILIGLGIWQYQRLQWKTALLAEIDASVTAPPITSLRDLARAIIKDDPVDFRRIEFEGSLSEGRASFHLYRSKRGGIYWDVFQPVQTEGYTIFAKTGELNNQQKTTASNVIQSTENILVTGYIRKFYPMGLVESWVKSKPSPETNRYFYFNQTGDWYEGLPISVIKGYYIDIVPAASASELPIQRPDIANNHFDYMLTWWSFALIFFVIYLLLHRRAGRLALR